MAKKLLFLFNPYSGKAQIKNKLLDIIDIFVKHHYEVTVHPTQHPQDAISMVKEKAREFDLIVCSGGDGTLDEVVTGMMQSEEKRPIGYIPAGSTNDFASSLRIPKDMISAAKLAVTGEQFSCDVGNFNGDHFVYIAAFGLFTDVSYETNQELKNVLGHAAYILEGAKRLYGITSYQMRVEYDGLFVEDEFVFGMITNSTSIGGFKHMVGKNVFLDDGVFEITLIKRPKNPLELQAIITSLLLEEEDAKYVYTFKAKHIRILSQEKIPWTLDGEFGGYHSEVIAKNQKQAVDIISHKKNQFRKGSGERASEDKAVALEDKKMLNN